MAIPKYTHYTAIENTDVLQDYDFEIFAVRNGDKLQYTLVIKESGSGYEVTRGSTGIIEWHDLPGHAYVTDLPDGERPFSDSRRAKEVKKDGV